MSTWALWRCQNLSFSSWWNAASFKDCENNDRSVTVLHSLIALLISIGPLLNPIISSLLRPIHLFMIWFDTVYSSCSQKLTGSKVSLPLGIKQKNVNENEVFAVDHWLPVDAAIVACSRGGTLQSQTVMRREGNTSRGHHSIRAGRSQFAGLSSDWQVSRKDWTSLVIRQLQW